MVMGYIHLQTLITSNIFIPILNQILLIECIFKNLLLKKKKKIVNFIIIGFLALTNQI